jgi:hypothetical protein
MSIHIFGIYRKYVNTYTQSHLDQPVSKTNLPY